MATEGFTPVTFKLTDASGNVSTATATVTVPHAQNGPLQSTMDHNIQS